MSTINDIFSDAAAVRSILEYIIECIYIGIV